MAKNGCGRRLWGVRRFRFAQAGALIIFLFPGSSATHAEQLTQLWSNRVDGPSHHYDRLNAIVADSNDNSYVTGQVCVSTSISDGCNGITAMLSVKYDKAGNVVWQDRVTTPGKMRPTAGTAIAIDAAGNVYVTGTGDSGEALPTSPKTTGELLTIKYSPSGQRLWMTTRAVPLMAEPQSTFGSHGIVVDSAGNSYIAGEVPGFPLAVIKYDPNGKRLWENEFAGSRSRPHIFAEGLAVDAQGSLYVVGKESNGGAFLPDFGGFTAKFDTNGNLLWTDYSAAPAAFNNSAIALDSSGNAYVTGVASNGFSNSNISFGARTEPVQEFVTKYGPSGNHVWFTLYQTPRGSTNEPYAIALDASGNVYTTGRSVTPANSSGNDYSTVKFDTTGNVLWEALYNGTGSGSDIAVGLAVDKFANVYVTGQSSSLGRASGQDYATVQYDTNGIQVSVARHNGLQDLDDIPVGIAFGSTIATVAGASPCTVAENKVGGWATLAYSPSAVGPVLLSSISVGPSSVTGAKSATGTVTLNGPAPVGGATVSLTNNNASVAHMPSSVTVPAGSTRATFVITTGPVTAVTSVTIAGSYDAMQSTTLTVKPSSESEVREAIALVRQATVSLGSTFRGTLYVASPASFATAVASAATGTEIYVASTQAISASVIITHANLRILCEKGSGFTISGSAYIQANASNIEFHGCTWTGTTDSAPILASANGFVFMNNIVSGFSTSDGGNCVLKINRGDGDRIENNHFSNNVNYDICALVAAGEAVSNLRISNNHAGEIVLHTVGVTSSMKSVTVVGNTLSNGQNSKTEFGIEVGEFGGNNPTDVAVTGNTVTPQRNGTKGGISLAGISRCVLKSDIFNGNGKTITIAAFEIVQATACSVTGNTEHGSSNFGYKFDTTSNSTLTANLCDSFSTATSKSCIWVGTSSSRGVASHNVITDNTILFPAGGAGYGIWQQCNADSALCQNNLYAHNTIISDGTSGSVGIYLENDGGTSSGETLGVNTLKSPAIPYSFSGVTFSVMEEQENAPIARATGSHSTNWTEGNGGWDAIIVALNAASGSSSVSLSSVSLTPSRVTGGTSSTGTVTFSGPATGGGITVGLTSSNTWAAQVPSTVMVPSGSSSTAFTVTTSAVMTTTPVTITANFNGTQTATLTVTPSAGGGRPKALIQQATATYAVTDTATVTLNAPPQSGDALVLFSSNDSVYISSVSGGGVTWVLGSASGQHSVAEIWYGLNSSGSGTPITVTYSGTGSGGVNVSEFSGVATTNALDVAPGSTSGVSATPTTPVATTTNATDLILAAAADESVAATTAGPTNSFTALTEAANGSKLIPAYQIVSATGSYSTNWTEGNDGWDAVIVALK